MVAIRGYGSNDTRAMMNGWTTVAPDLKTKLFDDAINQVAKTRAIPSNAVKLKNISIDIPSLNTPTESPSKRTVKITPQVDMVLIGFYSEISEKIVISRVAGETLIPEHIFYTNRPAITPIVLLKGYSYQFLIEVDSDTPTLTDLLLSGVQIGDIPTNLVQYTIDADDGVAPSA